MNVNIKLPNEIQEKLEAIANERLEGIVEDILKNDKELDLLLRDTIQKQVKSVALRILQGDELRSKMAQKCYPIIYETLGLEVKK